jgi:hypothetical protein
LAGQFVNIATGPGLISSSAIFDSLSSLNEERAGVRSRDELVGVKPNKSCLGNNWF